VSERDTIEGCIIGVVKEVAHIHEAKKPGMGRCTGTVHDAVGGGLDSLVATFCRVLLLLVRFTLPVTNDQSAQNVENFVADLHLSAVTDELVGSTSLTDVVFKGVNKLAVSLDAIDISNLSVITNKQNSGSRSIVNGRNISVDNVTCNGLLAPENI